MLVFSTRLPLKAEITHEDCMRLFTKWVKGSPHYQTDGLYFDVDSHDDYDYTKDNMGTVKSYAQNRFADSG